MPSCCEVRFSLFYFCIEIQIVRIAFSDLNHNVYQLNGLAEHMFLSMNAVDSAAHVNVI